VAASRTSPDSVSVAERLARTSSDEAASMRSTAEATCTFARQMCAIDIVDGADLPSKSSKRRRTALMERPSRSAGAFAMPQC